MVKNERRQFPRLDVKVTVKYKILTNMEKRIFADFESYVNEAQAKNVSVDGLCIITPNLLENHTIMALEMIFPEQKAPLRALGRVIWSKPDENTSGFCSGVEFVAIKDKSFDQMSQLIAEYVVDKYKIKEPASRKGLIELIAHLFKKEK